MIKKLPPEIIRVISSGQIASSPSAVIKELIENSLDAKATKIKIQVETPFSFQVSDNGTGIKFRELPLTVERFSTSKISSLEDFKSIKTYGFRGEALFAIASVSKLTVKTKHEEEEIGGKLTVKGGEVLELLPFPYSKGTKVEVRELFFNTPVRRKSVKRNEKGKMVEVIKRLAIANNNVTFQVNEELFPATSLEERINQIFPKIIFSQVKKERLRLFFTKNEEDRHKVSLIFVNRRPVKLPEVEKVLEELRINNYILFLEVEPEDLDVNVTPLKDRIFIKNEKVIEALKKELKVKVSLPRFLYVKEKREEYKSSKLKILGSDGTVVVCCDEEYYYFFDQHLLHERVNYEKLLKALENNEFRLIPLTSPITIEYGEEIENELKKLGVSFLKEGNLLKIEAIPEILTLEDVKRIKEGSGAESIAEIACKKAIKSGYQLEKIEEIEKLIEEYLKCEDREFCPHGRPIYVRIRKSKILRELGR